MAVEELHRHPDAVARRAPTCSTWSRPNNPADERLVALAEVRDVTPLRDADGKVVAFPAAERVLAACLESIRRVQAQRTGQQRLDNNRVFLHVWPTDRGAAVRSRRVRADEHAADAGHRAGRDHRAGPAAARTDGSLRDVALRFAYQAGAGVTVTVTDPPTEPLAPLDEYTQKVQRAGARGTAYPYEIVPMLTGPNGSFTEYDFDADGKFGPVERPPGQNTAGVVAGVVTTPTPRYPEGITRVALFGDPTKALGTVAVRGVRDRGGRHRSGRGARCAGGVVHAVVRREDLDGQRHREHGRRGARRCAG